MSAIKPNFLNALQSLKRDEEARKKGATEEERDYYSMSLTKGWKMFKEKADELIKELDSFNDTAVEKGMSYEELGKNAVVISLTKGIIKRLIDTIEDSKEACEQPEGDKG